MAIVGTHELEKEILEILGLTGRMVRRIDLKFEVNELVMANVEFSPTPEEMNQIVETIKEKYIFKVVEVQDDN